MPKRLRGAEEMADFAKDFIERLEPMSPEATVIALSGELGAGKTTFAQAAARALGVEETVNSPTFVIEKIYSLSGQKWQRLVHIDAYRLKSADELRALGWDELISDAVNIILIEWPEHVPSAIPVHAHKISIQIADSSTALGTSGDERTLNYGN